VAQDAARTKFPEGDSEVRVVQAKLAVLETDFEKATADLITSATLGHPPGRQRAWILENGYLVQTKLRRFAGFWKVRSPSPILAPTMRRSTAWLIGSSNIGITTLPKRPSHDALQEFQIVRALTTAELWSFAQMLRVALLEDLARLACDAASSNNTGKPHTCGPTA